MVWLIQTLFLFVLSFFSFNTNLFDSNCFLISTSILKVLPLENEMADPAAFRGYNGVLNTSMVLVASLYTAVGFYGYLKFGDKVKSSITFNLPAGM